MKGWIGERSRHSMASKGIKTKKIEEYTQEEWTDKIEKSSELKGTLRLKCKFCGGTGKRGRGYCNECDGFGFYYVSSSSFNEDPEFYGGKKMLIKRIK